MPSIDIHFHAVPRRLADALRRRDFDEALEIVGSPEDGRLAFHAPPGVVVEPNIRLKPSQYDEQLILQAMDQRKLDAAAVSLAPELFLNWASPELRVRLACTLNGGFADMARFHPVRFVPLAAVLIHDGARAARELERAVSELKLKGAAICTHVNGKDLDDPGVAPVLAMADRLEVPLFLHPQNAGDIGRIKDYHLWNVIGFPLETVTAASRLIASGAFERFPRLKIVLAHGGGFFPYQIGRLDHGYRVHPAAFKGLPKPPSAYLSNIYCDSLTHSGASLSFLIDRMGPDHVVLGSDYPLSLRFDTLVDAVDELDLPADQEKAVSTGTLATLLRVS